MEIVGRKFGRYEVLEHIGEGAMAQVYKAYDTEINRAVALKVLKEEHCEKEEYKSRFLKEGRAAGALAHPNIVTIYDVGSIEGAPYIMMELLEGATLADMLQRGERLSLQVVLKSCIQLADALDYAHGKGVIHRDMKPDNIMLDKDSSSAKIADFGIARVEDASSKESTQVGTMLGTPRYMSPEQASGNRVDGRSDLFSLGVIMYEMITGQKAFDAESMHTLILQIVQKNPVPIRQISAGTPVGLQKIVNKLLQKKPEKRFQSGGELKEALQRELEVLLESEEEQSSYLPLHVKWTAIMGGVVAVAMALSSLLIFNAQRNSLNQQAIDSGIALSKFVAVQAAIPVLGEDWITLESLVQDAAARDTFSYLIVRDHEGVVRSSSNTKLVGNPWELAETAETLFNSGPIVVTDLGGIFNFSVPVLFNDIVVGSVNLGLDTGSLDEALATTSRMMTILALAIVLAVSFVIYIFNKAVTANLLVATGALKLFGQHRWEVRISKKRKDEFGDLFASFNAMADSVEQLLEAEQLVAASGPGAEGKAPPELDISGISERMVSESTVVNKKDDGKN